MKHLGILLMLISGLAAEAAVQSARNPLDPRGQIHIPIGIANTVDALKTFVEAEGNFSPGFGSYGIYFWIWDEQTKRLIAPTIEGVKCEHGLSGNGYLIPWAKWSAGNIEVKTEVCEVKRSSPAGEVFVVGARAHLSNVSREITKCELRVALRALGAAGWAVRSAAVGPDRHSIWVEGHAAIVANQETSWCGVSAIDLAPREACSLQATSPEGNGFGVLVFEVTLAPGETKTLGFTCPVLPGRRVLGHKWDGVSTWAQFDLNVPNPAEGGVLQPDPGQEYWRNLKADALFQEAEAYWRGLLGRTRVEVPGAPWGEAFNAIVGHSALSMNEGAPDVAVVNYNVFNRDGVYMANIFQKSGNFELSEKAIDYFLGHPFNGRVQPEADNPGQVLWVMGEHWKFTRDGVWLERVYPSVRKLAAMIRYYRTTPEPHWVWDTSLEFGNALSKDQRKQLRPGACDGHHPEYTEAFDIAGLRAAVVLASGIGNEQDANNWRKLANDLFMRYDQRFGAQLAKGYGSYSVLWPCQLYPFAEGRGQQFKDRGAQKPAGWRYFPLATAHQGLFAGNRSAGWETLAMHLQHPQMQGWCAFDEGGASGTGGWNHVRTTWKQGKDSVAMPHGWAIAEFFLLLRDSLAFEDGQKLVLLSGISPAWFTNASGIKLAQLPTHFGKMSLTYTVKGKQAELQIAGVNPPAGFVLRLPAGFVAQLWCDGQRLETDGNSDCRLPSRFEKVMLKF